MWDVTWFLEALFGHIDSTFKTCISNVPIYVQLCVFPGIQLMACERLGYQHFFLKSPQTNLSRTLMKTEAVFLQSELAMTTVGIKLLRPVAPQDYATSLYFENIIFRLYWFLHWRRKQVFWIKSSRALRPSQPTASFNHSSGLDNSHTSLAWFKAVFG